MLVIRERYEAVGGETGNGEDKNGQQTQTEEMVIRAGVMLGYRDRG